MSKNIVIIGAGATGTAALIELNEQLKKEKQSGATLEGLEITVVSDQSINGPGYAYNPAGSNPKHLLNQMATAMSARPIDEKGDAAEIDFEFVGWKSYDFFNWMKKNRDKIVKKSPEIIVAAHPGIDINEWQPEQNAYYSRGLYGLYMQDTFEETIKNLKNMGINVTQYNRTKAIEGKKSGKETLVTLKNLETGNESIITADKLLLATGRWINEAPTTFNTGFYFDRPFPAQSIIEAINPSEPMNDRKKKVIVQGMGLSGIDTILSMTTGTFYRDNKGELKYEAGENHAEIIATSRSGYFSIVKDLTIQKPPLKYVTQEALDDIKSKNGGYLTLVAFKPLIERELEEHLRRKVDLAEYTSPSISAKDKLQLDIKKAKEGNAVYGIFQQILAYQPFSQLTPEDKELFLKNIRTQFLQNIAAMPLLNAEKITALLDAGVLTAKKLGYDDPTVTVENNQIRVDYTDNTGRTTLYADYLIRASGDNLDITKNTDPLIQSLLKNKEIIPNKEPYYDEENAWRMLRTSKEGAVIQEAGVGQQLIANNGGIKVDLTDYSVIRMNAKGREEKSGSIYALGMPVMNWGAERDFASSSTKAAVSLVNGWIQDLKKEQVIQQAPRSLRGITPRPSFTNRTTTPLELICENSL